jgi:hypothetical protein
MSHEGSEGSGGLLNHGIFAVFAHLSLRPRIRVSVDHLIALRGIV